MISNYIDKEQVLQNGILKQYYQEVVENDTWTIKPHQNQNLKYVCLYDKNDNTYSKLCDTVIYLEEYLNKIYNKNFNSILIGGLGLGLVPYMCQNFCGKIHVVEIDNSLINLISNRNYLNSNVVIYNQDIFNFTTNETFDVILIDIWDAISHVAKHDQKPLNFDTQIQMLTQNLSSNLNENGLLYFPIIDYYNSIYS